jgi:hypothetical protein
MDNKDDSLELDILGKAVQSVIKNVVDSSITADVKSNILKAVQEDILKKYGPLPEIIEINKEGKELKSVTGIFHEAFSTIVKLVSMDLPVYLSGEAGTGKNVICKQVAEALGLEFYFTNAVTQEYKLTGFIDAGGHYHETQFYKAFKNGGLFFLDELDASIPEVLIILNAAIANRYFDFPTGKVAAHADFRLIAAGNTYGTGADNVYSGRYNLDGASMDRFNIIPIRYSEKIELYLTNQDKDLLTFCHAFRKATKESGINCIFSYRSLEAITKLKKELPLKVILKICLIKGMGIDDIIILQKSLEKVVPPANEYLKAFHELK